MATCQKRKKKNDGRICLSAFNKTVIIQLREIQTPGQNSVDYSINLSEQLTVRAMVETVRGVTIFDNTNTERDISHKITLKFRTNSVITAQNYAKIGSVLLDIVDVENVNEDNRYLVLRCALRGPNTQAANF